MENLAGIHKLVLRARSDQAAQEELFNLIYKPLQDLIAREFPATFDTEEIEQIAHDSVLMAITHANKYRGENEDLSAMAWIFRITRNRAKQWIKVKGKDEELDSDEFETLIVNDEGERPVEEQTIQDLFLENLFTHLCPMLNETEKAVFLKSFIREEKDKQIAMELALTPARICQIKSAIKRKCHVVM